MHNITGDVIEKGQKTFFIQQYFKTNPCLGETKSLVSLLGVIWALVTLTLWLFSLCHVGKLTKPTKYKRNLVASGPVAPSDLCFLWVGFPPCGQLLLTFPEFVVAWRADTFSLFYQCPSLLAAEQGQGQLSSSTGHPPSPHPFIPMRESMSQQVEQWTFLGQCAVMERVRVCVCLCVCVCGT